MLLLGRRSLRPNLAWPSEIVAPTGVHQRLIIHIPVGKISRGERCWHQALGQLTPLAFHRKYAKKGGAGVRHPPDECRVWSGANQYSRAVESSSPWWLSRRIERLALILEAVEKGLVR